ncbi:MAG TPA: TonB family protein, partial [Bacteroidales bacterium]|nr:TonB family protein [Bacteroidales bacterium]
MEEFAFYLLKSVVWLSGFVVVYLILLRNERFFILKRTYLLTGIIASFVFPLITLHYRIEVPIITEGDMTVAGSISAVTSAKSILYDTGGLLLFLSIIYLSGIVFLGYRLVHHVISLRKMICSAEINDSQQAKLVKVKGVTTSFSFFNYVFIDPMADNEEVKEILNHELIHIQQKHWFDLTFAELLCLVQWFNPFAWIYTRLIRQNHEYLADEAALRHTSNPAYYKAVLINQLFGSKVISLTNSFNYSINQTRFNMMKKIIVSPYRKLRVLYILPVFVIVFYAFAKPDYKYTSIDNIQAVNDIASVAADREVRGIVIQKSGDPLEGAAIVIKGTTVGTKTDNKGFFKLTNVSDEALLVVTYVGFKSKVLKPAFDSEMKIEMVQDTLKADNFEGSIPPPP